MKFLKTIFCFLVLFNLTIGFLPSYAQDADDDCSAFCTDKEKFPDKYKDGYLRPDGGIGVCKADTEVAEDICCCEKSEKKS